MVELWTAVPVGHAGVGAIQWHAAEQGSKHGGGAALLLIPILSAGVVVNPSHTHSLFVLRMHRATSHPSVNLHTLRCASPPTSSCVRFFFSFGPSLHKVATQELQVIVRSASGCLLDVVGPADSFSDMQIGGGSYAAVGQVGSFLFSGSGGVEMAAVVWLPASSTGRAVTNVSVSLYSGWKWAPAVAYAGELQRVYLGAAAPCSSTACPQGSCLLTPCTAVADRVCVPCASMVRRRQLFFGMVR